MPSPSDRVNHWLHHIQVLAGEIGPRGSTTEGERRGTQYCADSLTRLGFTPRVEAFSSARSIYLPHLIASAVMLAAFAIYPLAGRVTAVLAVAFSALALLSDLMELSFRDNLLRRIVPKGASQNAVAAQLPSAEHLTDLVLIGHVDSHRTPIIFSTPRWLTAYRLFTTVAFVLFAAQVVLYGLGALTLWNWIWAATIPSALAAVLLAAMCLQADATLFSRGANDNASGAGLVLTLAREFKERPLAHTRVWYVLTGCEEVQHYGAIDFFRRHRGQLVKPQTIAFEMLGCAGPSWLVREGILIPFHADAGMVRLAERVARENPHCKAHSTTVSGGNTEMADALRLGIPAITLSGWGPHGEAPYWHMVADTVDKMDPEVMERAFAFTAAYIRALDEQARP
jgi:Peptidase family M28